MEDPNRPAPVPARAVVPELLPAVATTPPPPPRPRWGLAGLLFLAAFFTTTTLGAAWYLFTRTDVSTDLPWWLTPGIVARVWGTPELRALGLSFSLPVLFILLCHELGHYAACRYYRLPATPPYFLPVPFGLGTLGAFIRIRAPLRDRRQLFDVGFSGPAAGFVALLPFLVYGLAHSTIAHPATASEGDPGALQLLLPGKNLAVEVLMRAFHGGLGPGDVINYHPFALAAWFGMLATALNLMPIAQLDGGHILHAVSARWQRRLAWPVWLALALLSLLWMGWILWCVIVLVLGLYHPPLRDETVRLDPTRRLGVVLAMLMLLLCFIPAPVAIVFVR